MERAKSKLEDLFMLWHEKRGGRPMPSRGDLPVSVLRPWLGNLALVDLTGAIPYFRLCGTGLHARFGGEMTGQKLDAIDDRHGRKALRQAIETVRKNPGPAQQSYTVPRPGGVLTFHELYVPLAFDGEHADTVLFASYAEQSR
jgi:hypothetical protein